MTGQEMTVNGPRYRGMTAQFCVPKLQDMDVDDTHESIQLPHEAFSGRGVCRQGYDRSRLEDGNWELYQRISVKFVRKGHGKSLQQESACVSTKPWGLFTLQE
ncbi:hypothetical protein TSMEX_001412 [Taenia solium]|eukprot:TsM_000459300 transcript=TsM_000459300 gene=TsM_000459300